MVARPATAWPKVPAGFKVEQFAQGLAEPRVIVTAPNGDLFVAESAANRVRVFHDADGDGRPEISEIFVGHLDKPFGIAFYPAGPNPQYIYIANTGTVVRYPYHSGDLKASGPAETIVTLSAGGHLIGGGHFGPLFLGCWCCLRCGAAAAAHAAPFGLDRTSAFARCRRRA